MRVLEPVAGHWVGDGEVVVGLFGGRCGAGGGLRSGSRRDNFSENHVCELVSDIVMLCLL